MKSKERNRGKLMPANASHWVTGLDHNSSILARASGRVWDRDDSDAANHGTWIAALLAGGVSLAVPTWLFGIGAIFARAWEYHNAPMSRGFEAFLVVAGAISVVCCARAAFSFGMAPRLRHTPRHHRLRVGAVLATLGVMLLIQRALWGGDSFLTDPLAFLGAVVPVLFLADFSHAMATAANGRHGTAVGLRASAVWLVVALLLALTVIGVTAWWLAGVLAFAAAICTAIAGLRVWQRYEGSVVMREPREVRATLPRWDRSFMSSVR
jgi:hypothetical protein